MVYRFGLIGYPISHSLSPWIHERFMEKTSTKGTYSLFEFAQQTPVEEIVKHLKSINVHGFNVTVPFKQQIMTFLDEIDPVANRTGAVNTVINKNGKWIGYNTDGVGYVRSLQDKFPNLFKMTPRRALILGAGGAARGIFTALVQVHFDQIDIANRTKEKAVAICRHANNDSQVLSFEEAEARLADYDIVIQTTSVGMKPNIEQTIITKEDFPSAVIYSDIIYQPIKTKFLQQAEKSGAPVHYGHTMLLYQAQYAFEIWTGKKPDIGMMDDELEQILKGR